MHYIKEYETKIVRTVHRITLYTGGDAGTLRDALRHVPDKAKLIDISTDAGENTILMFQEENRVE